MKKNTPDTPVPALTLPISLENYQRLLGAAGRTGFKKEAWEIGAAAIHDWLARNAPEVFGMPLTQGYQWKHLFLPNGTLLRTVFKGQNFHSLVEDDKLLFNGIATSPSGFVNSVGGVRRNAWKVIWILFPNTATWKAAEALRSRNATRHSTAGSNKRS